MSEQLTVNESSQLKRHEAVIQAGKNTFVSVGLALTEIRDKKLYRQDYSSFDLYLAQRWGWSRQRAGQLIQAAAVVQQLPEKVSTIVDSEGAARALKKVPKGKRAKVVEAAAAKGKVTAKAIKVEAKKAEIEAEVVVQDCDGVDVPKALIPLWDRGSEISGVLHTLSGVKAALRAAQAQDDPLWRQVNFTAALADLSKCWTAIQVAKPYAVCPQCQGHPEVQKCRLCLNTGIIGKFRYQSVPKELLDVRKKAMGKK
jgi:hypothetical protein